MKSARRSASNSRNTTAVTVTSASTPPVTPASHPNTTAVTASASTPLTSAMSKKMLRELHIDANPSLVGEGSSRKRKRRTSDTNTSLPFTTPASEDGSSMSHRTTGPDDDLTHSATATAAMATTAATASAANAAAKADRVEAGPQSSSLPNSLPQVTAGEQPKHTTTAPPSGKKRNITDYFFAASSNAAAAASPAKQAAAKKAKTSEQHQQLTAQGQSHLTPQADQQQLHKLDKVHEKEQGTHSSLSEVPLPTALTVSTTTTPRSTSTAAPARATPALTIPPTASTVIAMTVSLESPSAPSVAARKVPGKRDCATATPSEFHDSLSPTDDASISVSVESDMPGKDAATASAAESLVSLASSSLPPAPYYTIAPSTSPSATSSAPIWFSSLDRYIYTQEGPAVNPRISASTLIKNWKRYDFASKDAAKAYAQQTFGVDLGEGEDGGSGGANTAHSSRPPSSRAAAAAAGAAVSSSRTSKSRQTDASSNDELVRQQRAAKRAKRRASRLSAASKRSSRATDGDEDDPATVPEKLKRRKGIVSNETIIKNWGRYDFTSAKHARAVLLGGKTSDYNLVVTPRRQSAGRGYTTAVSKPAASDSVDVKVDSNDKIEKAETEGDRGDDHHKDDTDDNDGETIDNSVDDDDDDDEDPVTPSVASTPANNRKKQRVPPAKKHSKSRKRGFVRIETFIKNWKRYKVASQEEAIRVAAEMGDHREIPRDRLAALLKRTRAHHLAATSVAENDVDDTMASVNDTLTSVDDTLASVDDSIAPVDEDASDEPHHDGDDGVDMDTDMDMDNNSNDDVNKDDEIHDENDNDNGDNHQDIAAHRAYLLAAILDPTKGTGKKGLTAKTVIANWKRYKFRSVDEAKAWLTKHGVACEPGATPTLSSSARLRRKERRTKARAEAKAQKKNRELSKLMIDAKPSILGSSNATPDTNSARRGRSSRGFVNIEHADLTRSTEKKKQRVVVDSPLTRPRASLASRKSSKISHVSPTKSRGSVPGSGRITLKGPRPDGRPSGTNAAPLTPASPSRRAGTAATPSLARRAAASATSLPRRSATASASKDSSMGPPPVPQFIPAPWSRQGAFPIDPRNPDSPWVVVNPVWVSGWFSHVTSLAESSEDDREGQSNDRVNSQNDDSVTVAPAIASPASVDQSSSPVTIEPTTQSTANRDSATASPIVSKYHMLSLESPELPDDVGPTRSTYSLPAETAEEKEARKQRELAMMMAWSAKSDSSDDQDSARADEDVNMGKDIVV